VLDKCGHKGYIECMKTVGIRVLKNKLSRYLDLVRQGETVLVTDRGEVIAEIRQPSPWTLSGNDSDWSFLQRLAAQGKMALAKVRGKPRSPPPKKLHYPGTLQELIDDVKGER
jgi:antitoxin (DNA-binding transcriptional repressor) of toxin-antitoxin stability system